MKLFAVPTSDEWIFLGIIVFLVVIVITTAEIARRMFNGSSEITRKFVHIVAGMLMVFAPYVFSSAIPAIAISVVSIVGTFISFRFGFEKSIHDSKRTSYGTILHPFAFLILILLFWDASPNILSISIMILAIPDALAAIVGQNIQSPHYYRFSGDQKSIEGSAVMFVSTFLCIIISFFYFNIETPTSTILSGIVIALFVTAWESICSKGLDNLSVPLSAAFILHFLLIVQPHHVPEQMITAVVLAFCIGIVSYYVKFLSASGSVATFLLATIVYGIGGWKWTVPILTFFIGSSILSKFGKSRKQHLVTIFDKTDIRDSGQVAANGGVAGLIVIFWYIFPERAELYYLYVAALTAVTADTWGTEIGILSKANPRSIISMKNVERGTSGAISLQGIIGGMIGACIVILSAIAMDESLFSGQVILAFLISGFAGTVVDSVLGASLQVQYKTSDGLLTERNLVNGKPTLFVSGIKWINNDAINWMCALSGVITMYFMMK